MTGPRRGARLFRFVAIASICAALGSPPVRADLLLHYDFNDASDPLIVLDQSGNDNDAEVVGAEYTDDGLGRTGEAGDRAMDFLGPNDGSHINVLTALDGAFDSINANDAATIMLWVRGGGSQPHNNSVFWFAGDVEPRVLQAHVPWGDSNIYFDVAGCCGASQRINAVTEVENFKGKWNHYAFVKDGPMTAIYINGELFLESAPGAIASLETLFITNVDFGCETDGVNSYNGLIDEIYVYDEPLNEEEIKETADLREQLLIAPTALRMRVGDEGQLVVTHFAADGTKSDVTAAATGTTYSVDPAGVVSVSADGVVVAEAAGEGVLTAKNGDLEAWATFVVEEPLGAVERLLWYDFNDASEPLVVLDTSGNDNDAEVLGPAEYTEDGRGRTGEAGDRAMDFKAGGDGAHISVITAIDGAFDSITENDSATITMWVFGGPSQPVSQTNFRFSDEAADPNAGGRILSAHIPWSNSNVYFDAGGCCFTTTPANRINAVTDAENFKGKWNHYAFVKDGVRTAIYQNGELFLESGPGAEMVSLQPFVITKVIFGSSVDGAESYHGLIDDIGVWDGPLSQEEIREVADLREQLVIAPSRSLLLVEDELQLQITHYTTDGVPTDVTAGAAGTTYSAEPAGVVSISDDGLVVGEAEGEAVIKVKNGDVEATTRVKVFPEAGEPRLLLYYDFNDDSDPLVVPDESGNGNHAQVLGLAQYTDDGFGRTGEDGDRAMDFGEAGDGSYIDVTTAFDGAFDAINAYDAATITLWVFGGESQPVNNSVFWFYGAAANGVGRVLQAHVPWSNSNIYFDVGGCCDTATPAQRINAPTTEEFFRGEWNHYAFVKEGVWTGIYQNGELFLEAGVGAEMRSLRPFLISNVTFGSATGGRDSYNGLIDEISVWDGALDEDMIIDIMDDGVVIEPEPTEPTFVRGDPNADGGVNLTDAVFVLDWLFSGGADPTCEDAADINDDGTANITDAVFVLDWLFGGGGDIPAPSPSGTTYVQEDCGPDLTEDALGCAEFAPCDRT